MDFRRLECAVTSSLPAYVVFVMLSQVAFLWGHIRGDPGFADIGKDTQLKRLGLIAMAVIMLLGTSYVVGVSAGEQYERNHLEFLRQQNKLMERQNDLLREQAAQIKRIADLMEKARM